MRRSPVIILIIIIAGIILMIIVRSTYVLQSYSFSTSANSPTIPAHHRVFTSIWKKPKRFDFIAVKNSAMEGSPVLVLRLCGMPGDSIEMKSGELFVNGRDADTSFSLSHSYLVSPRDTAGMLIEEHFPVPDAVDSILITYPDKQMNARKIMHERYRVPVEMVDAYMEKVYKQPWNIDNFGPLRVPANSYFLLGDNRSNAMDSRYLGFINKRDFRGTVLSY